MRLYFHFHFCSSLCKIHRNPDSVTNSKFSRTHNDTQIHLYWFIASWVINHIIIPNMNYNITSKWSLVNVYMFTKRSRRLQIVHSPSSYSFLFSVGGMNDDKMENGASDITVVCLIVFYVG